MNTGQMMITIGAIFLLAMVILRVNTNLLVTQNVLSNSKVNLIATSLATSAIEEITSKRFDQQTVSNTVLYATNLTPTNSLGIESGDVYPNFNDIDDYNDFYSDPKIDSIEVDEDRKFYFETFCHIYYVSSSSPGTVSGSQTWDKRIDVKVTGDAMIDEETGIQDTIKMSTIMSYWFF